MRKNDRINIVMPEELKKAALAYIRKTNTFSGLSAYLRFLVDKDLKENKEI